MNCEVFAIRGTFFHTPVYGQLETLRDKIIVVADGKISRVADSREEEALVSEFQLQGVRQLKDGQYLLPGFIDTHVHAPQYEFTGTGTDLPLMEWLERYTFPVEAAHGADPVAAAARYTALVRRLLGCGTTCAVYFGCLAAAPCRALVDVVVAAGQRALVGKVSMDRLAPDYYCEGTAEGLAAAEEFIAYTTARGADRVLPVVTPRFIPTCTTELMRGLAELARRHGTHIQSHISESMGEVALSRQLQPEHATDAAAFDAAGLLTPRTIMAHATQAGEEELRLLAARGTAVAHCPLSNFFFGDGGFRVNHALSLGLKVGLGSDVAGGVSPSLLTAQRMAVVNSRALRAAALQRGRLALQLGRAQEQQQGQGGPRGDHAEGQQGQGTDDKEVQAEADRDLLSWKEALWLATVGGAQAVAMPGVNGSFVEGAAFDALLIDVQPGGAGQEAAGLAGGAAWGGGGDGQAAGGCSGGSGLAACAFDLFADEDDEARLEKFLTLGDDRNIAEVYVQGVCVKRGSLFMPESAAVPGGYGQAGDSAGSAGGGEQLAAATPPEPHAEELVTACCR